MALTLKTKAKEEEKQFEEKFPFIGCGYNNCGEDNEWRTELKDFLNKSLNEVLDSLEMEDIVCNAVDCEDKECVCDIEKGYNRCVQKLQEKIRNKRK